MIKLQVVWWLAWGNVCGDLDAWRNRSHYFFTDIILEVTMRRGSAPQNNPDHAILKTKFNTVSCEEAQPIFFYAIIGKQFCWAVS